MFFNQLTSPELLETMESSLPEHRERLFPPTETLSMFLAQALKPDRSGNKGSGLTFDILLSLFMSSVRPAPRLSFAAFVPTLTPAADTVCARVKIEIKQELTLMRQAFDAQMKINTTIDGVIQNVLVGVKVTDENGVPVAWPYATPKQLWGKPLMETASTWVITPRIA